jgi:hypothetical protein
MKQPPKPPPPTCSSEDRGQWISRYPSSGLTQVQFAQQHGVKLKTLRGWLCLQRRRRAASTIAQKTTAPEPKPPTTTFREIKALALWSGLPPTGWVAEVTWPSAVTVPLGASAEALIVRPIDLSHASRAQLLHDAIV